LQLFLAFILFIAIKTSLTCSYGSKFHQVINISLSLRPHFLILASDGLWDTFSNEEACTFVQEHLKESDFGAKSLVMESYKRGSVDNITVLVIVFKNDVYKIGSSAGKVGDETLKVPAKSQPVASAVVQRSNSIKTK